MQKPKPPAPTKQQQARLKAIERKLAQLEARLAATKRRAAQVVEDFEGRANY